MYRRNRAWIILTLMALLTRCMPQGTTQPNDPLEPTNRAIYHFNQSVDRGLIRPIAQTYQAILPEPLRKGVTHMLSNLSELSVILNDIMQLRLQYALEDTWRLALNSTIGIGGFFDVARYYDLPHRNQNFALTLKTWGAPEGSFIVLPLLGPSTTMNILSWPIDHYGLDAATWIEEGTVSIRTVDIVDQRTNRLPLDRIIEDAFDPYTFTRNAYQQRLTAQFNALNPTTPPHTSTTNK